MMTVTKVVQSYHQQISLPFNLPNNSIFALFFAFQWCNFPVFSRGVDSVWLIMKEMKVEPPEELLVKVGVQICLL